MGGESGPKARPSGVVDGKQVNIPVLLFVGSKRRRKLNWVCLWIAVEAFKALKDRKKTNLELRRDPAI